MSTTEVPYSKSMPEAWDGLLSHAQNALAGQADQGRPFCLAASAEMVQAADVLATDPLDANLYYGLGLGMCDLYTKLRTPEAKDRITDTLRRRFEQRGLDANSLFCGPLSAELFSNFVAAGVDTFRPLADQSIQSLPIHTRLTVEALAVTTRERRKGRSVFTVPGIVDSTVAQKVSQGGAAARLTALNSIGGSVLVWRKAVEAKQKVNPGCSRQDVENQDLTRVAAKAAGIHSDEFTSELLNRLLVADEENGNLTFDRSQLPAKPEAPEFKLTDILHRGREKCPALFVGRLMLISDVLDIVWDAGQRSRPSTNTITALPQQVLNTTDV